MTLSAAPQRSTITRTSVMAPGRRRAFRTRPAVRAARGAARGEDGHGSADGSGSGRPASGGGGAQGRRGAQGRLEARPRRVASARGAGERAGTGAEAPRQRAMAVPRLLIPILA